MNFRYFPYAVLAKFPHMLGGDVAIWTRFIQNNPRYFEKCAYDVHIGEGQPTDPSWDESIQLMAKSLTQRRIDVLGVVDEFFTIVEVKVQAGTSAIGQLLCYRTLFQQTFSYELDMDLLLITDLYNRDVDNLCSHFGIYYKVI